MQTVYIVGNPGFREHLNKELHDNSSFIRGQVNVEIPEKNVELYWINNRQQLREFKKAIGADLVWKYRLNFYFDLEKLTEPSTEDDWSADEKALMKRVLLSRA